MNRTWMYVLISILLIGTAQAVFVAKGTTLEPSQSNFTWFFQQNVTVNELSVYNDSVSLNGTRLTMYLAPDDMRVNVTVWQVQNDLIYVALECIFAGPTPTGYSVNLTLAGSENVLTYATVTYNNTNVGTNMNNDSMVFNLDCSDPKFLLIGTGIFSTVMIYDEETGHPLVDRDTYLEIWGDTYTRNYTVVNGSMSIESLPEGDYEFRYWADAYRVRSYYLTATNASYGSLKLFSISENASSLIQYQVTDTAGQPVPGAYVHVERKFIDTNAWEIVSMSKSDANGEGVLYLHAYDISYRFKVLVNGVVYKYTDPMAITRSVLYLKNINLLGVGLSSYFASRDITTSLTFNNASNSFEYSFTDPNGWMRSARLDVWERSVFSDALTCTQSLNASSGTLVCNMSLYTTTNRNYEAIGYIDSPTNSSWYDLQRMWHSYAQSLQSTWGTASIFYALIFILVIAMIGLWNPSMAIIMTLIGTIITVFYGILPLSFGGLAVLAVIGLLIIKLQRH